MRNCSQCESESVTSVNQEPLCREHAEERLEELRLKRGDLIQRKQSAEAQYEKLLEKYDVSGYGEIDHLVNGKESPSDLTEEDVQKVNKAEQKLLTRQQELKGVTDRIEQLKQGL